MHEENELKMMYGCPRFIIPELGYCNLVTFENDGEIPHFHLISSDMSFSIGINLLDASYCDHNKSNYILTEEQIKVLINRLNYYWEDAKCTIWCQLLMYYYDCNEEDFVLPEISDFTSTEMMPNYNNLIYRKE